MPKQTLLFAASLLDEISAVRNTLPQELTLEDIESTNQVEARFQILLLELAELPMIQLALPELLDDDEVHVIAFLLAILHEESIPTSRLMTYIEAQVTQEQVFFPWLGWLPEVQQHTFLQSCFTYRQKACDEAIAGTEDKPVIPYEKKLAAIQCVRNHIFVQEMREATNLNNTLYYEKEWLLSHASINDKISQQVLLDYLLTEIPPAPPEEQKRVKEYKILAALGLISHAHPAGLEYLRQADVIEDESSGYGRWLACHGTEADLRLLEKRITVLLLKIDTGQIPSSQSMNSIIGIFHNLGQYGDIKTSLWIHKNILQRNEARLRFEGFSTMLNLFDQYVVAEGYQLRHQADDAQDDYGTYKDLNAHEAYAYWGKLQKSMSNKQLLPPGHCRSGKALDQLDELSVAVNDLTFGDNKTADFIRLTFALISGQHCALDAYAPYQVYSQQRDDLLAAIDQYRLDSQYLPGSFRQPSP